MSAIQFADENARLRTRIAALEADILYATEERDQKDLECKRLEAENAALSQRNLSLEVFAPQIDRLEELERENAVLKAAANPTLFFIGGAGGGGGRPLDIRNGAGGDQNGPKYDPCCVECETT